MDNRGETWKTLLVMTPILAATLVAVSRIMDARHHPFDVITGSLLGVACAMVSYRQYFPPISEAWRKGRAYPIRTWGTEPARPIDAKFSALNESMTALHNTEENRQSTSYAQGRSASPPQAGPGSSSYANSNNPFTSQAYPRRAHDHDPDGNWSSSEDDVGDGFEMHHGYARAQNPGVTRYSPSYDTNTAYPSQTYAVTVSAGRHSPTGGEGTLPEQARSTNDAPAREV